jgi:hypothetical protein
MRENTQLDDFFETVPTVRVGFFTRLKYKLKSLFRRKRHMPALREAHSAFKHFYEDLTAEDANYTNIHRAATLADDALRTVSQRLKISARLGYLEHHLLELNAFMNLSDEEIDGLKRKLERFVSLAGERSILLEKLTDYDSALVDMEPVADMAREVVPTIKDAEKQQRALRMDIGYLTGEKEELIHERDTMDKSLKLLRMVTISVIGVFALAGIALTVAVVGGGTGPLLPVSVMVVLIIGFFTTINMFRMRLLAEMRRNTRKQHRAVELLNKKAVVYAYYTNFLRYCYKKYKANTSRTLEKNLDDLESYRYLANRIDTVRNLMYETETDIERFVREKKLGNIGATIEGFARTINLDDKRRRFNELMAEKQLNEKSLAELDRRHETVWEILQQLKKADKRIEKIILQYMAEAEKLFRRQEKAKEGEAEQRPVWKLFEMVQDVREDAQNGIAKNV